MRHVSGVIKRVGNSTTLIQFLGYDFFNIPLFDLYPHNTINRNKQAATHFF